MAFEPLTREIVVKWPLEALDLKKSSLNQTCCLIFKESGFKELYCSDVHSIYVFDWLVGWWDIPSINQ